MNTKTRMEVPDIGGLLGKITDKQGNGELGKTDRQKVVPVSELKHINEETEHRENIKTNSQENVETKEQGNIKIGGRPTTKSKNIEYVRIGAVIPKSVRQQIGNALTYEMFHTVNGQPFRTIDEIVTHALEQLLKTKAEK